MENNIITRQIVPSNQRAAHTGRLFGARFLWIESFVFDTAGSLSPDYDGGLWEFYELNNGGFYMAPSGRASFVVQCANGFSGRLSADALGIVTNLYTYSMLSFSPDEEFAQRCADHFHRLREFALQHDEVKTILAATD